MGLLFKKKIEEKEIDTMYLNLDGEQFFFPETHSFAPVFNDEQKDLLLQCLNNRISVRAVAYSSIEANEMKELIENGILANLPEIEVWKIGQVPTGTYYKVCMLDALRHNVNIVENVPNITKCQSENIRIAAVASFNDIDITSYIKPGVMPDKLQKILDKKMRKKERLNKLKEKCM